MTKKMLEMKKKYCKEERVLYDMFEVSIEYWCGMFNIQIIGGWDDELQVPEYGFGTGFCNTNYYYGGFDEAVKVALKTIRESNESNEIKNKAQSALAFACCEFRIHHHMGL